MFDDFDYTSSADPDLAAHGWSVRTMPGGPGPAGATWSADAITFPADHNSPGGHVMQLSASTDGAAANTVQSEINTTQRKFLNGTYAARVKFTDSPAGGPNGDFVYETFYAISPLNECDDPTYSEDDYEYLPNGDVGGSGGPRMYTTSYYTYCPSTSSRDRSTTNMLKSWAGWHTLAETVKNGTVTYYIDGNKYWSTDGKYYPRKDMTINFNLWFNGLLSSSTTRTWNEQVAWAYYHSGQALTTAQVQDRVKVLSSHGINFTDTVPTPAPAPVCSSMQATDPDARAQWDFTAGCPADLSGNANDGTAGPRVTFTGSSGAGFDGSAQGQIVVPYSPGYQPEAISAGQAWHLGLTGVIPAGVNGQYQAIATDRGPTNNGWILYLTPAGVFQFWMLRTEDGKYVSASSGVTAVPGKTYDIEAGWDGTRLSITVTGDGQGSGAAALGGTYGPAGNVPLRFGAGGTDGSTAFYTGKIATAKITIK